MSYNKQDGSYRETDSIPTPKVIIDQDSDPNATVVEVTFGNRLGALLDTVRPFAFLFKYYLLFMQFSFFFFFFSFSLLLIQAALSCLFSYCFCCLSAITYLSCFCLLSVNGLQMNALKNLGLNVVKANVYLDSSGKHNKFAITRV